MNEAFKASRSINYMEIVEELEKFIELEKEQDKIIKGHVNEVNPLNGTVTVCMDENFNFYEGFLVLMNKRISSVLGKYGNNLKLKIKDDPLKFKNKKVSIDTSINNVNLKKLEKTIQKIKSGELDYNNQRILNFITGEIKPIYTHKNIDFITKTLNKSQKEAVSLSMDADDFHLIIGPPGTGKTFVITEIVRQLVKREQKVLITAWTNNAVDNMVERLSGFGVRNILRIGSKNSISPSNIEYSLEKKMRKHKNWIEVEILQDKIVKIFDSIEKINGELDVFKQKKNRFLDQKNKVNNSLNDLSVSKAKFEDRYGKLVGSTSFDFREDEKIYELENKVIKLEKDSDNYYSLSKKISKLNKVEGSLTDSEDFYELKSEIKKMELKAIPKRIVSPFRKNKYELFKKELADKKAVLDQITDSYTSYWNFKDDLDAKFSQAYPELEGQPEEDALDTELELLIVLREYLPLKMELMKQKMEKPVEKVVAEVYEQYLKSIKMNMSLLKIEIKSLDSDINSVKHLWERLNDKKDNLNELIEKCENDKQGIIEEIALEMVSDADVIAATAISSSNYFLEEIKFDCVVVDEASQVASYWSLIPLMKCKKFVLVGDDKQLEPIEESKLSKELNLSIFNRLMGNYRDSSTFLDVQYRMNKEIADIASDTFYEGKLKTFEAIADQTIGCDFDGDINSILRPENPLTFLDTSDLSCHEDITEGGCENTKEAKIVAFVVSMLLKNGIDPDRIGVITPYKKHKKNIRMQISNDDVDVDTVHRFQGREKDVVVISFCKSGTGYLNPFILKFVGKPTQTNVAITRARMKLIIVGNSKTLRQNSLLGKIIHKLGNENIVKCSHEMFGFLDDFLHGDFENS